MNIKSFLRLVEIQTKAASMIPFLLGTVYVLYRFQSFNTINFVLMLISLLCIDMTTTALNNYVDYKKAIKKHGFGYESHNAIVKYKLRESSVIAIIVMMLIIAAVAGVMLFISTDIVVLLLGAVSFIIGIIYSFGPVPISRTPLGELFSGFTMGFVITFLAAYIHISDLGIIGLQLEKGILAIRLNASELFYLFVISIMPVCGISNIMLANNICDIEEDIDNRRYTLPVYIGRQNALQLFKAIYYIGYLTVAAAIIMGIIPLASILTLATLVPVSKNIREFCKLQSKKDTFVLAVKSFVIGNAVQVSAIAIAAVLKLL